MDYRNSALVTRAELQEILARHSGLAADVLAGEEDTPLALLGMESLAAMEIQAVLTDEYAVVIPEEAIPAMSLNDVADFVRAVQEERAAAAGAPRAGA